MRWKCICCYNGTNFHGWQSQACRNTIQDFIEQRLEWIFSKKIRIYGCSRTDAGVHAYGQVFHFDGEWEHSTQELLRTFHCGLPSGIKVLSIEPIKADFHARFSAKRKIYIYNILEDFADPFNYKYVLELCNKKLNIALMNELAHKLIGEHNFSAFSVSNNCDYTENSIKNITQMEFVRNDKRVTFTTTGNGYLYKMVRSLVGTLVSVGLGQTAQNDVYDVFLSKKRTHIIKTAPACGLFLKEIIY